MLFIFFAVSFIATCHCKEIIVKLEDDQVKGEIV